MPELPEVELAARIARRIAVGRTITSVRVLHPSQRRGLPARAAKSLVGDRIVDVQRRGKSQRFRLTSGRELHVHFRMTGDWLVPGSAALPKTAPERLGPLSQYAETANRPLFADDRRPKPFSLQPENGEESQAKAFDYKLTSVMITPTFKMAILTAPNGSTAPLRMNLSATPSA